MSGTISELIDRIDNNDSDTEIFEPSPLMDCPVCYEHLEQVDYCSGCHIDYSGSRLQKGGE